MNQFHALPFRVLRLVGVATALGALFFLTGCGGGSDETQFEARDITAEVQEYYANYWNPTPQQREAIERGALSIEDIPVEDRVPFFRFATPEDIPEGLNWEDGMHLPELGSPNAVKGGISRRAIQDFPRTLRIVGPDSNGSFRPYILDDTRMQMAHIHPDVRGHQYFPGVAEEWAVDYENKTVYVRIDPDARWSDGEPITADDYMFMFFFFQSDYIRAPWYNNWYSRNYTNITKYDDLTFSVSVPERKPDMNARVLELHAIPEHFYLELGDDYVQRYQWRFVPTHGPYVINDEDIRKGQSITLTRLEDWWAKDKKFWRHRFNPDRIFIQVIRDNEKAFETFMRGDLDSFSMNLAEYYYEKLPNDHPDVQNGYIWKSTFYNDVPRPTYGLWINSSKPLLDNRDIRVGINYASNWQLVIDKFFRGDYERMRTTSDGYGAFSHPTLEARPFDVEKALTHFAKAGFNERGSDGILVNEAGQRLSFTLTTGYEALEDILTILREEALKAGLEFRLEVLDGTTGWKKVQEKKHDIMFSAFGVSVEMYPRYWETWHSVNAYNADGTVKTQTNNLVVIANDELDRLIEAYRASESAEEMQELAHQMEEILFDEAVFVPGFVQPFYRVAHWRWNRFPEETFNVLYSRRASEYYLDWIIPGMRDETLRAKRAGETFETHIDVYDQYQRQTTPLPVTLY